MIGKKSGPKIMFCIPCPHSCLHKCSDWSSSPQIKKQPNSRPPQLLPIVPYKRPWKVWTEPFNAQIIIITKPANEVIIPHVKERR